MMLITRPEHDITTQYLSKLSKPVIDEASKRGITPIIDLVGPRATAEEFNSVILKTNPKFIFLNGHGDSKSVTGNGFDEVLLECGKNEDLTKYKIVYARACNSSEQLGSSCVTNGKALAYIGYKDVFVFPTDDNKNSTPEQDEIAKPCIEVSNMIPLSLIKGNTVTESIDKANQQTDKRIEYYETHYDYLTSFSIIICLRWNKLKREFHGDGSATL